MSNYYDTAIRKKDLNLNPENWEEVEMLDNYFGHHNYGVKFPNGEILKVDEVYFRHQILNGTSSYTSTKRFTKEEVNDIYCQAEFKKGFNYGFCFGMIAMGLGILISYLIFK